MSISHLFNDIDSFFFPTACYLCSTPVSRRRQLLLCASCRREFIPTPGACCLLCRAERRDSEGFTAGRDCSVRAHANFRVLAAVQMVAPADRLVHALKFHDRPEMGVTMALLMARRLASAQARNWDLVAPLPLHRTRERERGYNQGLILAEPLARLLKAELEPRLLTRTRSTARQADLDHRARAANVAGAFRTRERRQAALASRIGERRVLLVDDVATTGHTLVAAVSAVLEGGARSAGAVVFALA
ncbi:MAG TPA: phosphoribosyltransferase family protein [Candidatus Eisenbacteria bacterium]